MELEINGEFYQFVFGFGFVKELNKRYTADAQGIKVKAGIDTVVLNLLSGDIETLVEVLKIANSTEKPRISEKTIVEYIENEDGTLLDSVLEAMQESNFTQRKTKALIEQMNQ